MSNVLLFVAGTLVTLLVVASLVVGAVLDGRADQTVLDVDHEGESPGRRAINVGDSLEVVDAA
jgi:hypothetical protein